MLIENPIPDNCSALVDFFISVYLPYGVDQSIFSLDAVDPGVQVPDPGLVIQPFFNFDLAICTGLFIIAELQKLQRIRVVRRGKSADNLNLFFLHAQIATPDQPGRALPSLQVVPVVFYLESIFYQVSNFSADIISFFRAPCLTRKSKPNCILIASFSKKKNIL